MIPVSSCTTCGAPIYGPAQIAPGEHPQITRSCACLVFVPAVLPLPLPYVSPAWPWTPIYPTWEVWGPNRLYGPLMGSAYTSTTAGTEMLLHVIGSGENY